MNLQLPGYAVPDRISITRPLEANACYTYANLDGPGMIQTIRVAPKLAQASRKAIIPICLGDEVERPEGANHGGWAFSFLTMTSNGGVLQPAAKPVRH